MAWRPARSLPVLHEQLKAGSRARPPATGVDEWGLLGDAAHDPTSDHAPKDFPGWGNDIVTAADFPNRPDLGLDAHRALDDIRRSRDPRVKYGISNGQIFSNHAVTEHGHSYGAWEWRPYLNSSGRPPLDGHYTHGHVSVVGDARADGTQPWQTIGAPSALEEDEDMGGSTVWDGKIRDTADGFPENINTGRVDAGADDRPAWIAFTNDLGGGWEQYALRVMWTKGDNIYQPLALQGAQNFGDAGSILSKGRRVWAGLPEECVALSIYRQAIVDGRPVPQSADNPAYPGPLGYSVERGKPEN